MIYQVKDGKKIIIADVSEPQVQTDWNQDNADEKDFIKNKPKIITLEDVENLIGEKGTTTPGDHAKKIPIDHPDGSVTAVKLADILNLQGKIVTVDTPVL
jgi:hypothetical protein